MQDFVFAATKNQMCTVDLASGKFGGMPIPNYENLSDVLFQSGIDPKHVFLVSTPSDVAQNKTLMEIGMDAGSKVPTTRVLFSRGGMFTAMGAPILVSLTPWRMNIPGHEHIDAINQYGDVIESASTAYYFGPVVIGGWMYYASFRSGATLLRISASNFSNIQFFPIIFPDTPITAVLEYHDDLLVIQEGTIVSHIKFEAQAVLATIRVPASMQEPHVIVQDGLYWFWPAKELFVGVNISSHQYKTISLSYPTVDPPSVYSIVAADRIYVAFANHVFGIGPYRYTLETMYTAGCIVRTLVIKNIGSGLQLIHYSLSSGTVGVLVPSALMSSPLNVDMMMRAGSSPITVDGGMVLTMGGFAYAFNVSGKLLWNFNIVPSNSQLVAPPKIIQDNVYFANDAGYLSVINSVTGSLKAVTLLQRNIKSAKLVGGVPFLYVAINADRVRRLNTAYFASSISCPAQSEVDDAVVSPDRGMLYFFDHSNTLYGLSQPGFESPNCSSKWNFVVNHPMRWCSRPTNFIISRGMLYTGCSDGHFYLLNASNGAQVKMIPTKEKVATQNLFWYNGSLYLSDADGRFFQWDEPLLTYFQLAPAGTDVGVPAICEELGVFFYANGHGVSAVDIASPHVIWNYGGLFGALRCRQPYVYRRYGFALCNCVNPACFGWELHVFDLVHGTLYMKTDMVRIEQSAFWQNVMYFHSGETELSSITVPLSIDSNPPK